MGALVFVQDEKPSGPFSIAVELMAPGLRTGAFESGYPPPRAIVLGAGCIWFQLKSPEIQATDSPVVSHSAPTTRRTTDLSLTTTATGTRRQPNRF